MVGQVRDPDRHGLADQHAEDPAPPRQAAYRRHQIIVPAGVHELLEHAVAADYPEGGKTSAQQVTGGVHDPAQHHRQAQVRSHRRVGAHQTPQPPLPGQHIIRSADQLPQQLIELQTRDIRKARRSRRIRLAETGRTLAVWHTGPWRPSAGFTLDSGHLSLPAWTGRYLDWRVSQ